MECPVENENFNSTQELGNGTTSEHQGTILASMDTIKIGIYFFTWIFGLAANFLGIGSEDVLTFEHNHGHA